MIDVESTEPTVSKPKMFSRVRKFFRKTFRRSEPIDVNEDVLELIFTKLDLDNRMRMGMVSIRALNVIERMPLIIPFIMFRNDSRGNYEIFSDNLELLAGYVLEECPGFRMCGEDKIVFNERFAHIVLNRILDRISGISQLWLETSTNGVIAQSIVDFYRNLNKEAKTRDFHMDQLTVIGKTTREGDFESLSALILLSRRTLEAIRLSHTRVNTETDALCLWTAIGQCSGLKQLQYEPCRLDNLSRSHIVKSLSGKRLQSLIMTGVKEMTIQDIVKIATRGTLMELAVVSDQIEAKSYVNGKAKKLVSSLNSLLISLDNNFNIDCDRKRVHLVEILKTIPEAGCLEIIQNTHGAIADITRTLSYWLRLSRETNRLIKLKLEDCSQERQDAAVGRLMRKSRESNKIEWGARGLTLSCGGEGRVVLLDKQTWFGYED